MMKNKILVGAALMGMLSMGQAFAGATSLQNATITGTYNGLASDITGIDWFTTGLGANNVTKLDPFENMSEFITSDFTLTLDFTKSGFLTLQSNTDSDLSAGSYALTFDFGSTLTETLSGFSIVDSSAVSATPVLSLLNDHAISISFTVDASHTWSPYKAVTAQLDFAPAVPEPFAPAMLLAGLGVLGLSHRFSKK